MTVKELIEKLQQIESQDLEVRVEFSDEYYDDIEIDSSLNYWVSGVEVSETGRSGYEEQGEVRLLVSE